MCWVAVFEILINVHKFPHVQPDWMISSNFRNFLKIYYFCRNLEILTLQKKKICAVNVLKGILKIFSLFLAAEDDLISPLWTNILLIMKIMYPL